VTLLLPQELAGIVKNARTAFERYKTYMTNLEAKETLEKEAAAEVDKEKRAVLVNEAKAKVKPPPPKPPPPRFVVEAMRDALDQPQRVPGAAPIQSVPGAAPIQSVPEAGVVSLPGRAGPLVLDARTDAYERGACTRAPPPPHHSHTMHPCLTHALPSIRQDWRRARRQSLRKS
jgi:hypothetical protein